MVLIKPKENWSDETSGFYDGPPPPPATYRGEVYRMGLSEVQSGDNKGTDKWIVSVKITDGKYKGATVLTSFTMIKSNAWSFNQFLESMTDGSEKQRALIKKWYYSIGYKIEDEEKYKKLGRQIEFIGKPAFKPIGKKVTIVTSMNGEYAQIDRFLVPLDNSDEEEESSSDTAEETATEETASDDSDDSLEGLEEAAEETADETAEEAVAEDDSDDDDPWG